VLNRTRAVLPGLLTCIAALLACWLYAGALDSPRNTGLGGTGAALLIVAVTAALADIVIIYIHAVQPPHPKHLLTWDRRLSIRAHAIAGSAETVLGIIAWLTGSWALAIATGLVAFVQIAAAFYQAPGVFGMKGVTVPMYYAASSIHLYCAINLVATGDMIWLERTWIMLQTYAYVRITYFLLARTGAFRGSAYTVSVMVGGAVTLPFVMGPIAVYFILAIVVFYLAVYALVLRPDRHGWSALFVEHLRRTLVPPMQEAWMRIGIDIPEGLTPRQQARYAFERLDTNDSGALSLAELQPLLSALGVSTSLQECLNAHQEHGNGTRVNFHTFFAALWLPSAIEETTGVPRDAALTEEQTGRLVFDFLDMDDEGYVDEFQIQILLLAWGMDFEEAERTIRRISGPTPRRYSYEDFRTRLRPIWRYGYERLTSGAE